MVSFQSLSIAVVKGRERRRCYHLWHNRLCSLQMLEGSKDTVRILDGYSQSLRKRRVYELMNNEKRKHGTGKVVFAS